MSEEEERQQQQLGSMTTEQIQARINQHQEEVNLFLEQLCLRSSLQAYTEQEYDGLLALVHETVLFLEEVTPLPLKWVEKRNELVAKLKNKF